MPRKKSKKAKPIIGVYRMNVGEKFYIGGSCNIKTRWSEHRYNMRCGEHPNPRIQKLFDEKGMEAFSFEIIETCQKRVLRKREQYWIDTLKPDLNCILINGTFPVKTPEEKAAFIKRISEARKKPIYQYDLEGVLIKEWKSAMDAGEALGIEPGRIRLCARGTSRTYADFIWRYELKEKIEIESAPIRGVKVYSRGGKLLFETETLKACCERLKAKNDNILSAMREKRLFRSKYFICKRSEEFDISQYQGLKRIHLYWFSDGHYVGSYTYSRLKSMFGMDLRQVYIHLNSLKHKPYKKHYLRKEFMGKSFKPNENDN